MTETILEQIKYTVQTPYGYPLLAAVTRQQAVACIIDRESYGEQVCLHNDDTKCIEYSSPDIEAPLK